MSRALKSTRVKIWTAIAIVARFREFEMLIFDLLFDVWEALKCSYNGRQLEDEVRKELGLFELRVREL
jgi:hypothetical protein